VIKQATESRMSTNPTSGLRRGSTGNQRIAQPLVIALGMVVSDVLHERATEVVFAHRDDPIQAFRLDGPHEARSVPRLDRAFVRTALWRVPFTGTIAAFVRRKRRSGE
jgi:hypothetical protein